MHKYDNGTIKNNDLSIDNFYLTYIRNYFDKKNFCLSLAIVLFQINGIVFYNSVVNTTTKS